MADDSTPDFPVTNLAAAAAEHHEVFRAWTEAGFTESQALELLKMLIVANATGGQGA